MGESLEPKSLQDIKRNESMEGLPSQYVKYLRENGFLKLKDLQLTIFLGPHTTRAHADDVAAQFKGIDVFILDYANAETKAEIMLRGISSGTVPPTAMPPTKTPQFFKRLMALIEGSNLHVAIADAPRGSKEAKVLLDAYNGWENFRKDMVRNKWSYDLAPSIHCHRYALFVRALEARERYIEKNLCPAIVRVYAEDQTKHQTETLNVLIFMGYNHETLYDMVKSNHPQTIKLGSGAAETYKANVALEIRSGSSVKSIAKGLQIKALSETLVDQLLRVHLNNLEWLEADQSRFIYDCVTRMTPHEHKGFYSLCLSKDSAAASEFLKKILIREGLMKAD